MGKDQRPVDIRTMPRAGQQPAKEAEAVPVAAPRPERPLPPGAVAWSHTYVDETNQHCTSKKLVPVGFDGRIVLVDLWVCPDVECQKQAWVLAGSPVQPTCRTHKILMVRSEDKQDPQAGGSLLPWDAMWQPLAAKARAGWVLLAVGAAGGVEQAAHTPLGVPLVGTVALTAGGYAAVRWHLTKRGRKHDRIEEGQSTGRRVDTIRRRARMGAYMGAAAGAWLTAAATVDPNTWVGRTILASVLPMWVVGAASWWRYQDRQNNRPESAGQTPAPAAATDDDQEAAKEDARLWQEDVAEQVQGLRHTKVDISTWKADEAGRTMLLRASRGGITDEVMQQAVPSIAGAFGVQRAAIGWVCEPETDAEEKRSPRTVLLMVQPNSPLNKPIPGKPVDVLPADKPVVHMGMRRDGTDLVTPLFVPGWGSPSRLLLGTKGSGKTATVRRLLFAQLRARIPGPSGRPVRLVAPFLHDPKRGADYGLFRRLVCGFSVSSDTLHMIVDALAREMDRRYDLLATLVWEDDDGRLWEGEKPFDPTTMGPVLSLTCDEFHIDAKDQALMAKFDPFGRKMRAAGIEINVATHAATIGDTGSQGFRDMLAGGEAWLLRTTMGLNAALATGGQLVGDPRALPRVPGMLLHASGEGSATMQARSAWDDPKVMYDQLFGPGRVPLIQPVEFPPETLEAFGPDFVAWMRECQQSALGSPVPGVPKVLQVGAAASGRDVSAEGALRQILLHAGGPLERKEIAEDDLWPPRSVTSTLTKALRAGQDAKPPWLVKLANGRYDLTPEVRRELAEAAEEEKEPVAA